MLRTWEIAGSAHADQTAVDYILASTNVWYEGEPIDVNGACGLVNDGPLAQVMRAGIAAFDRWTSDAGAPEAQPLSTTAEGVIVRDELGNARGGIRTPSVDAPTTSLSGASTVSLPICALFGSRSPLTNEQLATLYTDHGAYIDAVAASARAAVRQRFLLSADARRFVSDARNADVP
jgi:hypothetical protein